MATVLVTGGAGFLGSHLVDSLLERGASVRVLDNLSTGSIRNLQAASAAKESAPGVASGRRLELVVGDVRDERLVRKAMRHVDCVFHLAAVPPTDTSPAGQGETEAVNAQGTLNVLQAATAEGVRRVVYASCASVYGHPAASTIAEDCPPQPGTVFAASKLAGEIYCGAYQNAGRLETVVLRCFEVYGPRQSRHGHPSTVPALLDALRRRRRPVLSGDPRNGHDLMYAQDAVEAMLAAADVAAAVGRTMNIASGQATSTLEILDILKHLLRVDVVPRLVRDSPPPGPEYRASIALAGRLIGWAPRTSLVAGLARTAEASTHEIDDMEPLLAVTGPHEKRPDV
jgi:UDP-glucose 4-epimerase